MLKSPYSGNVRINIATQGQEKKVGGSVWWPSLGLGSVPGVTILPHHRGHNLIGEMSSLEQVTRTVCCASYSIVGMYCTVKFQFFLTQKVTIFINLCDQEELFLFCPAQVSLLQSLWILFWVSTPSNSMGSGWGVCFPYFLVLYYFLEHITHSPKQWEWNVEMMTIIWG